MGSINIRVDNDVKNQVKAICGELGLDITTATNMFYRQLIREKALPFTPKIADPFFTVTNQNRLAKAIEAYEVGKSNLKAVSFEELVAMEEEEK